MMRDLFKRISAFFICAVILIAAQSQIMPRNIFSTSAEGGNDKKVLLIQDNLPWSSNANTKILSSLGIEYQKVTTNQFLDVNLEEYALVIFANDQPFSTYNNYLQFKEYMELYASLGGVIIFGACDAGWADGSLTGALPGNVEKTGKYTNYNYVTDMTHPIITAELSDGDGAAVEGKNDPIWYSTYCSHSEFYESTLPAGSNIIVRSSDTDNPTLVEYPLGNGRVIASGLTWEYSYEKKDNFSKKIMDDLFLYALKVSDFDGSAADQLRDFRLNINKHHILVNDAVTKSPVAGAVVKVGNETYISDENGMISIDGKNTRETVVVSADGYLTTATEYTPRKRSLHVFFLKEDNSNGKPYAVMATEVNKEKDLFTKTLSFTQGKNDMCKIKVLAEWNGHAPGKYELVQYGANGVRLTSTTGIFSFAPGIRLQPDKDVYLILRSSDGTASVSRKLYLKVDKYANTPDVNTDSFSKQFTVTPNQSGTTGSEDVASLVGDNFEVQLSALPVYITSERNDDEGTCTVRFLIGIDAETASKSSNVADYFKNTFTDALEDGDKACDLMNSLYDKINGGKYAATGSLGIVPEVSLEVLGYYEMVYDANHSVVSQGGGIAVNLGGEVSYTQQFALAIIPIYLNVTAGAELEVLNSIIYNHNSGTASYEGSVTITVSGSISGGLGVNGLVSVGAGGGLDFEIGISPQCTGSLTLRAFIEAYLIFVIDFSYDFAQHTWNLWPKNNGLPPLNRRTAENADEADADDILKLIDMGYLDNESAWNGSVNDGISILKSGVLPSTIPVIAEAGGNKVMVWQTTDAGEEALNSTKLMYSYFENGAWTEPQPVCENEGADLTAKLFKNGDDIYLIWQKQNELISGDDFYEAAVKAVSSSDIFAAKWNGSKFDDITCVIDDDTLDMLPSLAFDGDKMTAVWVKCNGNILDPAGTTNTVMASDFSDGKWQTPYIVAETEQYISELTSAYIDGSLCTAYTASSDSASELHIVYNGSENVLTNNDSVIAGITFNNGRIYCTGDGKLYSCEPSDTSLTAENGDLGTLTSTYVMSDDGLSVVYSSGDKFYISVKAEGAWTKASELASAEGFTAFNYRVSENDGKYSIVMNGRNENKESSIVYIESAYNESISIEYADVVTDFETGEKSVMFKITNHEVKTIESADFELSNADSKILKITENTNLAPGQSATYRYPINTDGINAVTDYDLIVSDDKYTAKTTVTLGKPDIALSVETYYNDDNVVLAVKASNLTATPVEAAIKICEDSVDGLQIEMKNAGVIDSNEDYVLLEQINMNDIDFNEDGVKYLFINADTLGVEETKANNSVIVVIYKQDEASDEDVSALAEIDVTDTDSEGEANVAETTTTTAVTTTVSTSVTSAKTTESTAKTTTTASDKSANSPKTGDFGTNAVGILFVAIAASGVCIMKRKKHEN